jgi:4-hydroxymandelate oxidase
MSTTVLHQAISMPLLIAPTAFQGLLHSEGECATTMAAYEAQTVMVASTFSTRSIEKLAELNPELLWLQLYLYKDLATTSQLVERAEAAGCKAVVLTVDTPRLGRRERDMRNRFTLPPDTPLANFAQEQVAGGYIPEPGIPTWETIAWLRSITSLPIVLKGILTAEDALLAVEYDVSAIIVSNHGGRQLDGCISSIAALPEIVQAVGGRCEIYLDGGVRRGTDILKALALGARAVLVGRPVLWGLTVNGQAGVAHVLTLLREELAMAMTLTGCSTLEDIHAGLVCQ